jgi:hypothetical protein
MRVTSYAPDVIARTALAFQKAVEHYDAKNREIIEQPRNWAGEWRVTYRRSGEVVSGGYRNIVDLGNLKDSQSVTFVNPFLAVFQWDGKGETPAPLVHEGFTLPSGREIPARRWTREALLESEIEMIFAKNFAS